ncbi:MAG: type I toxin-antitoxin system SymE family toxin [Lachnospiraceae bacterium]|nr:type I toxin-antitoxin system SymE family toxin [Lachnospiraceae bacterium]
MKGFKEYRKMKVYEQSGYRYKSTPTIMLKGAWLRDCGFDEGTPITVKCESGRLTITRADEVVCDFREVAAEPVMCVAEAAGGYGRC